MCMLHVPAWKGCSVCSAAIGAVSVVVFGSMEGSEADVASCTEVVPPAVVLDVDAMLVVLHIVFVMATMLVTSEICTSVELALVQRLSCSWKRN